jgi:hypothetical protein
MFSEKRVIWPMLTVHLDTQDYIRLYKPNDDPKLRSIRETILSYSKTNAVKFPLSFLTLFEFMQDFNPSYREDRIARARFLSEICSTNTLPFFFDLVMESRNVDENTWLPSTVTEGLSFGKFVKEAREKFVRSAPTREMRRKLANNSYFKQFIKMNRSNSGSSDFILALKNFPVDPLRFNFEYFLDYLIGDISESEAKQRFLEAITEPLKFFHVWFDYCSNANPLTEFFGQSITKLHTDLLSINQKVIELKLDTTALRTEISASNKKRKEINQQAVSLGIPIPFERVHLPEIPKWRDLAGSYTFAHFEDLSDNVRQVMIAYMGAIFEGRIPVRSDAVDIFNTVYISRVDLWRGDRAMCNLISRTGVGNQDRIVPTLEELPQRIDDALAEKFKKPTSS